jgi:hypothetical protein
MTLLPFGALKTSLTAVIDLIVDRATERAVSEAASTPPAMEGTTA